MSASTRSDSGHSHTVYIEWLPDQHHTQDPSGLLCKEKWLVKVFSDSAVGDDTASLQAEAFAKLHEHLTQTHTDVYDNPRVPLCAGTEDIVFAGRTWCFPEGAETRSAEFTVYHTDGDTLGSLFIRPFPDGRPFNLDEQASVSDAQLALSGRWLAIMPSEYGQLEDYASGTNAADQGGRRRPRPYLVFKQSFADDDELLASPELTHRSSRPVQSRGPVGLLGGLVGASRPTIDDMNRLKWKLSSSDTLDGPPALSFSEVLLHPAPLFLTEEEEAAIAAMEDGGHMHDRSDADSGITLNADVQSVPSAMNRVRYFHGRRLYR